jgi:hypothetical protein
MRLVEIRRAREAADWNAVQMERHPAPLVRFLKRHPEGAHAPEALKLLASLRRLTEQDAWAEVKDCDVPIALQAYLSAFPDAQNAKAAGARLRALSTGQPLPPISSASAQVDQHMATEASSKTSSRLKRPLFWGVIAVVLLMALGLTFSAFDLMRSQYGANNVTVALTCAAILLAVTAIMLQIVGPRLYPPAAGAWNSRAMSFHAIGAIAVLAWMSFAQAVGEANHQYFSSSHLDNVSTGVYGAYPFVLLVTLVAVRISFRKPWFRFVYYGLLIAVGGISVTAQLGNYGRDYWVTAAVAVCGGSALVLLGGGALFREVRSWLASPIAAGRQR